MSESLIFMIGNLRPISCVLRVGRINPPSITEPLSSNLSAVTFGDRLYFESGEISSAIAPSANPWRTLATTAWSAFLFPFHRSVAQKSRWSIDFYEIVRVA